MLPPRLKALVVFTTAWFAVTAGVNVFWFEKITGGIKAPDAMVFGYGGDHIRAWMDNLGPNGAESFLLWHTSILDFVFPFLLMAALFFVLRTVLGRFERFAAMPAIAKTFVPLLLVAPYGLFDVLENGLVAKFLKGEVPVNDATAGLAATYTVLKWSFVALAFVILLVFGYIAKQRSKAQ